MKYIYISIISVLLFSCTQRKNKNQVLEGKTEREQLSVVSKIPGKIVKVLVEEGMEVKAGDTLMILEVPEVDAKRDQAKGAVNSAEAQYNMAQKGATAGQLVQLNAKVSGLKEQMDFAKKSLDRLQHLLKDSLVTQQQYDEVFAKHQGARNQYIAAVAEFEEAKSGARSEQQRMALGQQERALGALKEVNIAEKERYIIAPQDMSIETITLKVGELALPGYALVSGFLQNTTYFRFTIAEGELTKIKKGEDVEVHIPYNNQNIKGRVVWVKPLSSYANITTAYPDFEQQQTLYEFKVVPQNNADLQHLLIKSTVTLTLK